MNNSRFDIYLNSLERDLPDYLESIRLEAEKLYVPIIRRSELPVIGMFLKLLKPKKILELGAGIGFSALYMDYILKGNVSITTIEKYDKYINVLDNNLKKHNINNSIKYIHDDALNFIKNNQSKYDLIFLDFAKGQYLVAFDYLDKILNDGGVIISDNILIGGDILLSKYSVKHRNRTMHSRMRKYMERLYSDNNYTNLTIPLGDGIVVSYKEIK